MLDQRFLVLVVFFILLISSFQLIFSSPNNGFGLGPTEATNTKTKDLQKPKPDPTPDIPISTWRGPVQPLALDPGLPPIIYTIPTNEPIVFLTIDDGWVQTPENHDWLVSHHLPI